MWAATNCGGRTVCWPWWCLDNYRRPSRTDVSEKVCSGMLDICEVGGTSAALLVAEELI